MGNCTQSMYIFGPNNEQYPNEGKRENEFASNPIVILRV